MNNRRARLMRCAAAAASFALTFVVLYGLYWRKGLAPFGVNTLMINDANWQYIDFFSYLKDALAGKNSIAYSFSKGLGGSGVALFAYYLASPLNLLVVFFEKADLHTFFALLFAIKMALAAAFFAWFLSARFFPGSAKVRDGVVIALLSVSYALGQYSIAQASNIMWLDGVYMLPLIMLGVWRVVQGERLWKLTVPVALAILFNWYSAGADCVFSILYFGFELYMHMRETGRARDWRGALNALVRYGVAMTLGVMISAALFFPTIMALSGTSKGSFNLNAILDFKLIGNPISTAVRFVPGSTSDMGAAALCCGNMALVSAVGLFMMGQLPRWKRNACVALAIIGLAILYWNPLVMIFSMLKRFYSYWYRYSYVCIAIVIYLAAVFLSEPGVRDRDRAAVVVRAMLWILAAGLVLCAINGKLFDPFVQALRWYVFACVALALMLRWADGRKLLRALSMLVCVAAFAADTAYNVALLMDKNCDDFVEPYQTYSAANRAQIAAVRAADDGAYRMVQTHTRMMRNQNTAMYDEPIGNGYWSNVIYASTVDESQMRFLDRLGYPEWADTLNVANTCQLGADSLLSVRYVLSRYPINGLVRTDLREGLDDKATYENPYCLPFALRFTEVGGLYGSNNPFEYQNALYSRLMGEQVSIYVPLKYTSKTSENPKKAVSYKIKIPEGEYAVYGNLPWKTQYKGFLNLNGRERSYYAAWLSPCVFYIPTDLGDTSASVSIRTEEPEKVTTGEEQFYGLDLKEFGRVTAALSARAAEEIVVKNGYARFTATAASDSERLYVSIPYDAGWTVTLNGEKLAIDPEQDVFENCLYQIPLKAGENIVCMTYRVPHMKLFIAISAVGVLLLAALELWRTRRLKRG